LTRKDTEQLLLESDLSEYLKNLYHREIHGKWSRGANQGYPVNSVRMYVFVIDDVDGLLRVTAPPPLQEWNPVLSLMGIKPQTRILSICRFRTGPAQASQPVVDEYCYTEVTAYRFVASHKGLGLYASSYHTDHPLSPRIGYGLYGFPVFEYDATRETTKNLRRTVTLEKKNREILNASWVYERAMTPDSFVESFIDSLVHNCVLSRLSKPLGWYFRLAFPASSEKKNVLPWPPVTLYIRRTLPQGQIGFLKMVEVDEVLCIPFYLLKVKNCAAIGDPDISLDGGRARIPSNRVRGYRIDTDVHFNEASPLLAGREVDG